VAVARTSRYSAGRLRWAYDQTIRTFGYLDAEATMTGTIARLQMEKGFGFIKDNAGQDYFFHRSAVVGEGMENLREGDSVEFTVGQGPKGPRAESVRRTST
jgi:CspA family cold shock protein